MADRLVAVMTCPRCGGESAPILNGYPSGEDIKAAGSGAVVHGGCVVEADTEFDNSRHCLDCGHTISGETVDWDAVLGDPPPAPVGEPETQTP
jgi:hypothetical protein